MQNYHRHTSYSNAFTPDSAATNEEYAKRAVELGHKVISSVEHGWQGYYFECFELAKKYNLKFVFGTEAYWVKNRIKEYPSGINKKGETVFSKDRGNHHIILLAKNENGRQAINEILSEANETGYYFKPRVDLPLLLSLPADDVFVTSACIAFSGYSDIDNIILQLYDHFKDNFMLEIQYHNTNKQRTWNRYLKKMNSKYGIKLIVGLDSHYIYEDEAWKRDSILQAKGVHYEDEDGWFMDYPDDTTVMERFLTQGVFTTEEIQKAMDNTDIILSFNDYDSVPIFSKDIKLPTLYPNLSIDEKNKIYRKLINEKLEEYLKHIPKSEHEKYRQGVEAEIKTYEETKMVDYPLLDYQIVKDAVEHGGLITATGRGSAVGFLTNTLCGFSKVDRFTSAIKLYPERFISTTRILETKSLPDIDLNVGTPEIFEEAQVRVLGQDHVYPMIAFGTLKKKSAFKLYAKAEGLNFQLANQISKQIGNYEEAVKNADEENKDAINLYDYVSPTYKQYVEKSQGYWGIISDKKKAPSAYLLYQGNIRKEIGLIKCKSESTKKEYITCVIDGAIAENYKFLKNDILKVDVVLLINKVFDRIGIKHFDVNELLQKSENDKKVWDLYANGFTIGMNQVEQDGSRNKCMKYKPQNISELSAFVAAIRPGFKSMYGRFERREAFSYGLKSLDDLIQTKQFPYSYMIYQENIMSVLHYAGFPMDQCYGIIKAIAKKHPEKVLPLKSQFIKGFKEKIIADENIDEVAADEYSMNVWQIINDNVSYSFNSSHAYSVALDSLYQAWQKANYPYEFYETLLQHYSDKGNKSKVVALKREMKIAFGIQEGEYRFGNDNRSFVADKEKHVIYPSLVSIKNLSQNVANSLFVLGQNKYDSFINLLKDMKDSGITFKQVDILIKIGYFKDFGDINQLLEIIKIFEAFGNNKFVQKTKLKEFGIPEDLVREIAKKETPTRFTVDIKEFLRMTAKYFQTLPCSLKDKIKYQIELLGYADYIDPDADPRCAFIMNVDTKYTPWIDAYCLKNGAVRRFKIHKSKNPKKPEIKMTWRMMPLEVGDVIYIKKFKKEHAVKKVDGEWKPIPDKFDYWINDYKTVMN